LQTAEDCDAFSRALDSVDASCPLVVDTPGTNPFDEGELHDLRRFIEAGEVEPVLVLAAGGDAEDAADIAQAFSRLGCRRMIVTRFDAARRFGAVLVAADAGDLAFTEVSATPSVAQGLKPVNPMSLARVLCRDPLQSGACAVYRVGKS
jgi:flagellar biosynthesis protein FlhF